MERPITVNNLHLYEKEALEREINDVINETVQCLDAYHALFSDIYSPLIGVVESKDVEDLFKECNFHSIVEFLTPYGYSIKPVGRQ
ncbi:hypothetical protein PIROE2DRAFT_16126, partial [Piromyces sp. E2]